MSSIINWIQKNKVLALLIVIFGWILWRDFFPIITPFSSRNIAEYDTSYFGIGGKTSDSRIAPSLDTTPPTDTTDRKVVTNTNLSLLVEDVADTKSKVITKAQELGGFMVDSVLNNPGQTSYAQITVRVPSDNLEAALTQFKSFAIKVTYENLQGTDLTDQYIDLDRQIQDLERTKVKYEEIRDKATLVADLVTVTREIISIQNQIDALLGRKLFIEKSADFAKVTLTISSDELALPYTPDEVFRPDITFKLAIRSLYATFRELGENLIWIAVYAVIWAPIAYIIFLFWKRSRK